MNFQHATKNYFSKIEKMIQKINPQQMDDAITLIAKKWREGKQIITLGNGGSALTALHFINDWNKSIYLSTGIPFYGRSLCDNVGLMTSYANDVSYQDMFSEQLKNILHPGDLVLAISGSGNSENVIRAIHYANLNGATTLGLCGYRGGRLKEFAQHHVWIDIDDMQVVEDFHAMFGHIVMQTLCGYMNETQKKEGNYVESEI